MKEENALFKTSTSKYVIPQDLKDYFDGLVKNINLNINSNDFELTQLRNNDYYITDINEPTYSYSENRNNFIDNLNNRREYKNKHRNNKTYINYNNKKESNLTKINSEKNNNIFKFNSNKNNFEPLITKKQNKLIEIENKNRERLQNRADILYGDDTAYFKKFKSKSYNYFEIPKQEKDKEEKYSQMAIENIAEKLIEIKKPLLHNDKIDNSELVNSIDVNIDNYEKIPVTDFVPDLDKNIDTALKYPLSIDVNLLKKFFPKYCDYIYEKYGKNIETKDIVKLKEWKIIVDYIFDEKIRLYKNNKIKKYLTKLFLNFTENVETEKLKEMLEMFLDSPEFTLNITKWAKIQDADLLKLSAKNANLNTNYTKGANIYNSSNELSEKLKPIVQNKLVEQKLPLNSRGILFKFDSEIAERIIKNSDFKKFIKDNIDKIPSCYENKEFNSSMQFTNNDYNMYLIFRNVDVINLKRDVFGNITGYILDTTDYNEGDKMNLVKAARGLQKKGKIEPLFVLVRFYIRKDNKDNI